MNKKTWQDDWTAEIYGRMHAAGVSGQELATACGFSSTYLSRILRKKKTSDTSKRKILAAMTSLERSKKGN